MAGEEATLIDQSFAHILRSGTRASWVIYTKVHGLREFRRVGSSKENCGAINVKGAKQMLGK